MLSERELLRSRNPRFGSLLMIPKYLLPKSAPSIGRKLKDTVTILICVCLLRADLITRHIYCRGFRFVIYIVNCWGSNTVLNYCTYTRSDQWICCDFSPRKGVWTNGNFNEARFFFRCVLIEVFDVMHFSCAKFHDGRSKSLSAYFYVREIKHST